MLTLNISLNEPYKMADCVTVEYQLFHQVQPNSILEEKKKVPIARLSQFLKIDYLDNNTLE